MTTRLQLVASGLCYALALSTPATAFENLWTGSVDADWNNAGNWAAGRVPSKPSPATPDGYDDAVVNSVAGSPVITADLSVTPRDIIVGTGAGNSGLVTHNAGSVATGAGNWMIIGRAGGTGTYLMNSANALTVNGNFISGESGTGTYTQTQGTLGVSGEFWVGQNTNSLGTFTLNGGTVNVSNWVAVGRAGGNGTMNINGGTFNKTGGGNFLVGDNSTGFLTQKGGLVAINTQLWIGQNGSSNGTYRLDNGDVTVDNWVAIGRENGKGTLEINGGSLTKTGGGNISIGTGANSVGKVVQTGGTFSNTGSETWIGESAFGAMGAASYKISGGTANFGLVRLGSGGSTGSSVLDLDGGTFNANKIESTSTAANRVINFNGGTLGARTSEANFVGGLSRANVRNGGARIDTGANAVTINQALLHSNIEGDAAVDGGLTKVGAGTLTLGGANTYTGKTTVAEGTLALSATGGISSSATIQVNAGATLDVSAASAWTLATTQTLTGGGTVVTGPGGATLAGTIAPGASPGTLTLVGNVTFTGIYAAEVVGGTSAADLIDVNGQATLGGVALSLTDLGSAILGDKYTLMAYDSLVGTFANAATDDQVYALGGGQWLINYNDTTAGLNGGTGNGFITITAVPEPATALLGGLGLLVLMRRRRL